MSLEELQRLRIESGRQISLIHLLREQLKEQARLLSASHGKELLGLTAGSHALERAAIILQTKLALGKHQRNTDAMVHQRERSRGLHELRALRLQLKGERAGKWGVLALLLLFMIVFPFVILLRQI